MRVKWAVLLISASPLLGPVNVSAQDPVTLSGSQLDGIVPTYQLDPTQYQLRVAVDAVAVADPDRARNTLLTDDAEALEAQQMPGEEPEVRCTPARRALLISREPPGQARGRDVLGSSGPSLLASGPIDAHGPARTA